MFLEHVNLTVSNVERSMTFYQQIFGFQVRWRGKFASGAEGAHIGDDRQYIALMEAEVPGRAEQRMDIVGLNHYGFVVDDIDSIKHRLKEMGVEPHSEQTYDPGKHLYFMDPDGIEIELVAYDS